jgi:hypothetical protein
MLLSLDLRTRIVLEGLMQEIRLEIFVREVWMPSRLRNRSSSFLKESCLNMLIIIKKLVA